MAKRNKMDFDTVLGKIHGEIANVERAAEVVPESPPTLTEAERLRLEKCEAIIQHGLETFLQVGQALLEIRNERLYRAGYLSFETYCRDKWQLSRSHVHRIIEASEVMYNLMPLGIEHLPDNEKQVRPLTRLAADDQRMVWNKIRTGLESGEIKKVTGRVIDTYVETYKREKDRTERVQTYDHIIPEVVDAQAIHPSDVPDNAPDNAATNVATNAPDKPEDNIPNVFLSPQIQLRQLKNVFLQNRHRIFLQVSGSLLIENAVEDIYRNATGINRPIIPEDVFILSLEQAYALKIL